MGRRPHGTGSLFTRTGRGGVEAWDAQWRVGGRLVKRRLGPTRGSSPADGFSKAQAERELRKLIDSMSSVPAAMDIATAGGRWIAHLEAIGRRRSTLMDYESAVRVHLGPVTRLTPVLSGQRTASPTTACRPKQQPRQAAETLSLPRKRKPVS